MHDAGGGGGSGSLIDSLDPIFTEIAGLLGELAGNEAAWSIFDSEETRPLQNGWMRESGYFKIPGPHGFETPALYVAMHPSHDDWDSTTVTNADRERLLQEAVTQVWNDSYDSWTMGTVSTVYRVASRNVWEPDPAKMATAVSSLSSLTRWLNRQLRPGAGWTAADDPSAPEWLTDLQQHWPATSASPQSFYAFWDDVNDKCSLYLHAAARLASTSAQVTATISDFQTNLLEATKKARDRAKLAVEQWQIWKDSSGAWPTGDMEDTDGATILGGISYAAGVISLYGPAAAVAGPISVVTGGLAYLVPDQVVEMEVRNALTASTIHNAFVKDLKKIESNMTTVLDALQTEAPKDGSTSADQGFRSYVSTVTGNRRDWSPPQVDL